MRQLGEDVGADQRDQVGPAPRAQPAQGVDAEAQAEPLLEIRDLDPGVVGERLGRCPALLEARHSGRGLQGVLRRDQPPDPVQPKALDRLLAERDVPLVRRIEGAPEQAYAQPRRALDGRLVGHGAAEADHRAARPRITGPLLPQAETALQRRACLAHHARDDSAAGGRSRIRSTASLAHTTALETSPASAAAA